MVENLVSAEDLLAKMRAGTKEVYEIRIRGLVIPVRILSIDEEIDLRSRMIAQNSRSGGDDISLAALIQKETLRTATFIAKNNSSMPDRFFTELKRDELSYLFNEYFKILEDVNPTLEQIKPESFMALVDAIKKNNVNANDLSLAQLKAVFISYQDLIQRMDIQTSPEGNLPGTPS